MDHAVPEIARKRLCGGSVGVPLPAEEGAASRLVQVLHLEDSPSDSDLAREYLAAADLTCVFRRVDTEEGFLAALQDDGLDLILADYELPGFDGLTAFGLARQLRPELPFLMLTGKLSEAHENATLDLGVTDYVLKRDHAWRLAPAVRRALAGRREAAQQPSRCGQQLKELVRLRTAGLEARNVRLAAANRDLESFIASATHDLRSPLTVIGGFARHLEERCADKLDPTDLDLRGFFLASTAAPSLVPIDMEEAVRAEFAELRPLLGERQVRLELGPLPAALGTPAMIRQVLANLLANAVKYTGPRESAVIEVSGCRESNATRYCVRDNGVGFDMRLSGGLFELFRRLHDPDEFPGTGIGLATVKRIVEKHGGRVWARGVPGAGARFCFTLPQPPPFQEA